MGRQPDKTLQIHPLPNPYPVPDRAISLVFQGQGNVLLAREALGRTSRARDDLIEHVSEQGDGRINRLPFPFDTLEFGMETFAGPLCPL